MHGDKAKESPTPAELLQEGTHIEVPLAEWVKNLARQAAFGAAEIVIERHVKICQVGSLVDRTGVLEKRVDRLRMGWALLVGVGIGSGAIGSGVGIAIWRAMGG